MQDAQVKKSLLILQYLIMDSSLFQEREESVTGIKELVQGMETVEKLVTKVEPSLPSKKHEPTKVNCQTI